MLGRKPEVLLALRHVAIIQSTDFCTKGLRQITPAVIRKLHSMAHGVTTGDAGEWKKRDNEIIEILPNGERLIRFVPTTAKNIPRAVELLCENYSMACVEESTPPLILIATFVFDSLCIQMQRMAPEVANLCPSARM